VTQRLNDEEVDRIAARVVAKLVSYAAVLLAAIFLAPPLVVATATLTNGMPFPVAVAIMASIIAAPLVALIWISGRRTR
jgi:hypothetical protein